MRVGNSTRSEPLSVRFSGFTPRVFALLSITLFGSILLLSSIGTGLPMALSVAAAVVLCFTIFVHTHFLSHLRLAQKRMLLHLEATEYRARQSEKQLAANRSLARFASTEAEALRKNALSLTLDLQLDHVLDRLLHSLAEVVPYESAQVFLSEDNTQVLLARESSIWKREESNPTGPITLDLRAFPLLKRVIRTKESVLFGDVAQQKEWRSLEDIQETHSWLAVPLAAGQQSLGVLCAGHHEANKFAPAHLRGACSVALTTSVAIQYVRFQERAQIFGAELRKRLSDLQDTQRALKAAQEQLRLSEGRFHAIFSSSPIAFSISSVSEGRLVDVNRAFELHCDYLRFELVGRTIDELNLFLDGAARHLLAGRASQGLPIRNLSLCLRTKAGKIRPVTCSADRIRIEGQECVLAAFGDFVPQSTSLIN